MLKASDLGPWGRLKLVEELETSGDHRVDALFEKLVIKFDHWTINHPNPARESELKPRPLGTTISTSQASQTSSSETSGSDVTTIVATPDSGTIPLIYAPYDNIKVGIPCPFCMASTVNGALPSAGSPPFSDISGGSGGTGLSGSSWLAASGPRDSNASLSSRAFLQDHSLVPYQSADSWNTVDFQYSSLQANPEPVASAYLTTSFTSNSTEVTSIAASLSVDGIGQDPAVTYNSVHLTNGETYQVQLVAKNVSSLPTGIYPDTFTITKYFLNGTQQVET